MLSAIADIEAKLDSGGSFYTFVDGWFTDIQDAISTATSNIITAISNAQNAIISEINANEAKIDAIATLIGTPKVDLASDIAAIEAKLDGVTLSNIDLIDDINTYLTGTIYPAITSANYGLSLIMDKLVGIQTDISDATDTITGAISTSQGVITDAIGAIEDNLDALPVWGDLVTKNWKDLTDLIGTPETTIAGDIADIKLKLDDSTYGLSAINTYLTGTIYPAIDEVEGLLKSPTYGLSALNDDLDTLLGRLTAARAGYLEYINNPNLATIPDISTFTSTKIAFIDQSIAAVDEAVAATLGWDAFRTAYSDTLATLINTNLDATVSSRLSETTFTTWSADWTSTRAALLDNLDDIGTIKTAVETTIPSLVSSAKSDIIDNIESKLTAIKGYVDEVESLLKDGTYGLSAITSGNVIASKHEVDKTTVSGTPYYISGLPANKVFKGTITLQIDTALGSGQYLYIEVWDGDSWARVWISAANAAAGTTVSIDIAGITDSAGNAIRIVTTATASRNFDYVFAYNIDMG